MHFIIISFTYSMMWFGIYLALSLSSSKYLATAIQRNNFITVLHSFFVPVLTCFYFLSLKDPFGYQYLVDDALRHLMSLSVGYYLVSGINIFRLHKGIDVVNILHHFIIGGSFLYSIFRPEIPAYFGWVLVPQATGIFYHIYVILKDTVGVKKERIEVWYSANFYSWIFFRFILEGLVLAGFIYYELSLLKLPIGLRIFLFIGFFASYYFNVYWMVLLLKKRKERI